MEQRPNPAQYYFGRVVYTNFTTRSSETHLVAISETREQFEGRCQRGLFNGELQFQDFISITYKKYRDYLRAAQDYAKQGGKMPFERKVVSNATRRKYLKFNKYDRLRLPKPQFSPVIHSVSELVKLGDNFI